MRPIAVGFILRHTLVEIAEHLGARAGTFLAKDDLGQALEQPQIARIKLRLCEIRRCALEFPGRESLHVTKNDDPIEQHQRLA